MFSEISEANCFFLQIFTLFIYFLSPFIFLLFSSSSSSSSPHFTPLTILPPLHLHLIFFFSPHFRPLFFFSCSFPLPSPLPPLLHLFFTSSSIILFSSTSSPHLSTSSFSPLLLFFSSSSTPPLHPCTSNTALVDPQTFPLC